MALWATKSEGVGLIICVISFQDFQPMWSWSTNVTDRQMDGRTTCNLNTAPWHTSASRGKNWSTSDLVIVKIAFFETQCISADTRVANLPPFDVPNPGQVSLFPCLASSPHFPYPPYAFPCSSPYPFIPPPFPFFLPTISFCSPR